MIRREKKLIWSGWIFAAFSLFILPVSCSPERSRAVNEPVGTNRDYREMLDRARSRQHDQLEQRALHDMQDGVRKFQVERGRLPTNLVELIILHYVSNVTDLPPGEQYYYDPVNGNVNVVRLPPGTAK